MRINENQIITSGTFKENVENHGTIRGGVFEGRVESFGGIEGGEFRGSVNVQPHSIISGGVFEGSVDIQANAIIKGGKFLKSVDARTDSTIENGVFNGQVTIHATSRSYQGLVNYATIKNGEFHGKVDVFGKVENGKFFGDFNLHRYAEVSDGVFHGKFHQWDPSLVRYKVTANIDGPWYVTNLYGETKLRKEKKGLDYPTKVEQAANKIVEQKSSYIDEKNAQSDQNAGVDLLASTQDFNNGIF